MIDPLFTLYCEDCEVAERPSRLWIRAEIDLSKADGAKTGGAGTQHYIECMNCGNHFKSRMDDHMDMEAVGDEEWRRYVEEAPASAGTSGSLP